jgi:hypothetical protein
MKTKNFIVSAASVACLALLTACGGGSTQEAAGTLTEAKQQTPPAMEEPVDTAVTPNAAKAAEAAAAAPADGDAASAAVADGAAGAKDGRQGNGRKDNFDD